MIFDMQTLHFIYASHATFQPIVSTGWLYRGVNMPKIGEKTDHLFITSNTVLQPCFARGKSSYNFKIYPHTKFHSNRMAQFQNRCFSGPLTLDRYLTAWLGLGAPPPPRKYSGRVYS